MKKFIPAVTLVTLLGLEPSLHAGWGSNKKNPEASEKETKDEQPVANTPGFNLLDDRSSFIELDYLFWRPQQEDGFFAMKSKASSSTQSKTLSLKQPDFDLSSGVRLAIGGFTCDSWDIGLKGTYLFSDATKHINTLGNSDSTIVLPQWLQTLLGTGTKGSAKWKMNFYTLDLAFGREYFMTKKFSIHPFIGLRGVHINQKLHCSYDSFFFDGVTSTTEVDTKFKAKQDVWGAGPRLGIDLSFYFVRNWAFLGGMSGSLLYTQSKIRESIFGQSAATLPSPSISPFNVFVKDRDQFGRANLDVYFGIGWDQWFNQGKQRVSLALLFEGSQWFEMNQWIDIDAPNFNTANASIMETKRHGDLSFIGGTVRLTLGF